MRNKLLTLCLWISAIGLATWFGGTLYQMLVVVPMWSHSPPESVTAFFEGTRYNETIWNFFGPPFMAARNLPLLAALFLGWHSTEHRKWLLIAVAGMAFGVIFTVLYVYPMNELLFTNAGRGLSAEDVSRLARDWIFADRLRFAVGTISFLAMLRALSLSPPKRN